MAKAKNTDKLVVQNAAKTLLANIRFASVDDPIRTITVTSSIPNEGKSTVSINLAQAIATSGKSVLLVEADMRRRSLSDMLGVRSRGGLYAVLSEQISIDQAIVETGQKNFYFLDAEPHIPNPADIIVSHRFAKLVKALSAKFQYVIFDAPPGRHLHRCCRDCQPDRRYAVRGARGLHQARGGTQRYRPA